MIFDKKFWIRALDRIVKTMAQTMLAVVTVSQVSNIFDLDWRYIAGTVLFAGLLSLLTAILFPGVELKEAIKESVLEQIDTYTEPDLPDKS